MERVSSNNNPLRPTPNPSPREGRSGMEWGGKNLKPTPNPSPREGR